MFQKDGVRSNMLSWVSSIYILAMFRPILKLKWKNQCKPRKIASSKHHHIQSLFLLKETFGVSLFLRLCYLPYIQYAINLPIHKSRIDFRRCISCWQCILCLFNKKISQKLRQVALSTFFTKDVVISLLFLKMQSRIRYRLWKY